MTANFPIRPILALCAAMLATAPALPALAEAATTDPAAITTLPAITVSTVATANIVDRVYAAGLIGPVETVLVQPQIQGQAIQSIEAEVGETVTKGQVLVRLSDAELLLQQSQMTAQRASSEAAIAQAEAQLVDAKAAFDEATRVLDRTSALNKQGNVSQASLDQAAAAATSARARVLVATQGLASARAQLKLVDAQIADLALKLKRTTVVAPVDGVVVERNVMIGSIATSGGSPMFQIVRDGALELKADVAEADILKLSVGQKVKLTFVGLKDTVPGTVRLVEPRVDVTSRLGRVRVTIEHPELVRSGMFADAEIIVAETIATVIPVSALGGGTKGAYTLTVTDGVVRQRAITTGIRDGGWIEVLDGLKPGDTIVTKAGAFVRDGDKINPIPDTPAETASN